MIHIFFVSLAIALVFFFYAKKLGFFERVFVAFFIFVIAGFVFYAIFSGKDYFHKTPPETLSIMPPPSPYIQPDPNAPSPIPNTPSINNPSFTPAPSDVNPSPDLPNNP